MDELVGRLKLSSEFGRASPDERLGEIAQLGPEECERTGRLEKVGRHFVQSGAV